MSDNWSDYSRRHMFSDEKWKSLTRHYPGLENQPPVLSRMAFNIVERGTQKNSNYKPSLPCERRLAYSAAAKKIKSAIEAMKIALDSWESNFEVLPTNDQFNIDCRDAFFRNLVAEMQTCQTGFSAAEDQVKAKKTGPNNIELQTYVWFVAGWFERNGLADRISAGEESYSLMVFIKNIFAEFNFKPKNSALAQAIRNYPKKPG